MEHYNAGRLKISHAETKRELDALRASPTFEVLPWVNAPADLSAANPKDAYLLETIRRHGGISALLTYDKELLQLAEFDGIPIISPRTWMQVMDTTDLSPRPHLPGARSRSHRALKVTCTRPYPSPTPSFSAVPPLTTPGGST